MDYVLMGTRAQWAGLSELRVGLGCMRLSTEPEQEEELALATIAAAVDAGVTMFDTARSYGTTSGCSSARSVGPAATRGAASSPRAA